MGKTASAAVYITGNHRANFFMPWSDYLHERNVRNAIALVTCSLAGTFYALSLLVH